MKTLHHHFISKPKLGSRIKVYNHRSASFGIVTGYFKQPFLNYKDKVVICDCLKLKRCDCLCLTETDYFLPEDRVEFIS